MGAREGGGGGKGVVEVTTQSVVSHRDHLYWRQVEVALIIILVGFF